MFVVVLNVVGAAAVSSRVLKAGLVGPEIVGSHPSLCSFDSSPRILVEAGDRHAKKRTLASCRKADVQPAQVDGGFRPNLWDHQSGESRTSHTSKSFAPFGA